MEPPVQDMPSPNHDARPGGVDMLVLHYTGMRTGREAIERLRDPAARVSAHYVVEEDGSVFRLVAEERRAWHAGVSFWQGRRGLNDVSVGIEIVNPGHEWGYRPFPAEQMRAVTGLSRAILARHPIPPDRVVAHSDIAPDRKQDPGELFDWRGLARAGIGLWPDIADAPAAPAAAGDVQAALAAFGYDCPRTGDLDAATRIVLTAFQRRFRPSRIDGGADADCLARLRALLAQRDAVRAPSG
ncbi:MAG: N-acetylmuramoyl-L-alanine amidase [Alphaproteobacteria bacterium]